MFKRKLIQTFVAAAVVLATLPLGAIPAMAAPASSPASVFYKFDVIAKTGQVGLTDLGFRPSINNRGIVAFEGTSGPGFGVNSGIYVGDGSSAPVQISSLGAPPNRRYSFGVQINDDSKVVSQYSEPSGSDMSTVVRPWDGKLNIQFENVATGRLYGDGTVDFDYVDFPSINNKGDAVVYVDRGHGDLLFSCPGAGLATPDTSPLGFKTTSGDFGPPMIADDGRVVAAKLVSQKVSIRMFDPSLASSIEIAGPSGISNQFGHLGIYPGISDDGVAVAFVGERGNGDGIFLSVEETPGSRKIVPVVGENLGPIYQAELGYDDSGNPLYFKSFEFDRVGVIHQKLGPAGIEGDSFVLSFIATPNAASRTNPATRKPMFFTEQQGLWTVRVDVERQLQGPKSIVYHATGPIRVAQIGDAIGGRQITYLGVGDALAGASNATGSRTERRGDHRVAFWAETTLGDMVVRGTHLDSDQDGLLDHWEIDGIDMDGNGIIDLNLRVLGARPEKRDIFLEVDWLTDRNDGINARYSHEPAPGVADELVKMFDNAPGLYGANYYGYRADGGVSNGITMGITLHLDAGNAIDATLAPYSKNIPNVYRRGGDLIGQPGAPTKHIDVVYFGKPGKYNSPGTTGSIILRGVETRSFHDIKEEFFAATDNGARELVFHYSVLAAAYAFIPGSTGAPFTAQASSSTARSLTSAVDLPKTGGNVIDLNGHVVKITSGTGAGQIRTIQSSNSTANPDRQFIIREAWTPGMEPDASSTFVLISGSSGAAESHWFSYPDYNSVPGNDHLITLGGFSINASASHYLANKFTQWRTWAHELGHTLALRHCGDDPNSIVCEGSPSVYKSLMSYAHQMDKTSTVNSYSSTGNGPFDDWANLKLDFPNAAIHMGNSLNTGYGEGPTIADYERINNEPMDVQGPTVVVQSPLPGAELPMGSSLTVALTATDDFEVASVEVSFDLDGDGTVDGPGETIAATSTGPDIYEATFPGISGPSGQRAVTVLAEDSSGNYNLPAATVSVTIPNTAPTAVNDAYSANADHSLAVVGPGVLGNDSDLEGDALTATLVAPPTNGTLFFNPNGSFTYKPATGFEGADSFTYTASDGLLDSSEATVSITVSPPAGPAAPLTTPRLYPAAMFVVGEGPASMASADLNNDGEMDLVTANRSSSDISVLIGIGGGDFLPEQRFAVDTFPYLVSIADLNSDDRLDLVVMIMTNAGSRGISVLMGYGDGTFEPERRIAVASYKAFAIADMNGDTFADLLTVNYATSNLSVLLGNGDGTFQPEQFHVVTSLPWGLVVADLNGDNVPDVATANGNSRVSVFLGNGDGTLQPEQLFVSTNGPVSIRTVDMNNDTIPDLVTVNQGLYRFGILMGNGDGTFQRAALYDVGANSADMEIADLNGDDFPDLLGLATGRVLVRLANGDGTFQSEHSYDTGESAKELDVADLNGDGIPDVVALVHGSGGVSVLLGNGDGTLQPEQRYQAGAGTQTQQTLEVADLNGDDIPDFAIPIARAGLTPDRVLVLFGNGDGTFPTRYGPHEVRFSTSQPAVADFNGDDVPDLATANGPWNNVSVLLGYGDGTFQPQQEFVTGASPRSVAAADVDGDDAPDLVTANRGSNDVSVLLGNGDGTFQTEQRFGVGNSPYWVVIAELNGDAVPDLVTANGGSNDVSILLGNGDGTFQPDRRFPAGSGPRSVATADIDRDNIPDLITANVGSNDVSVLLGNGDGTFQPEQRFAVGPNPRAVAAADLNDDGNIDVVTANMLQNWVGDDVSVLMGNGDGTFQPEQRFTVGPGGWGDRSPSVEIADVDGDDIPDLVTANESSGDLSVLIGNGDGTFQPEQRFMAGNLPRAATVADLDGDQLPDIAVMSGNFDVFVLLHAPADGAPSGNLAPIADPNGPYAGAEGDTITVDASASSDPDGSISLYEWDLDDDGQYDDATGVTADAFFGEDGSYAVGLRVTDDQGETDATVALVTVVNAPPTIDAGSDQTANEGDTVSLASTTFTDPGLLDTHTATVDWGDNSPVEAGNVTEAAGSGTVTASHVYADNGTYIVKVCVTDDEGATACDTFTVTVNNAAPAVEAGNDQTVVEGSVVGLDPALFADPGTADTHTATIDWGDGTVEPGTLFQQAGSGAVSGVHTYGAPGTYNVSVCVTDDDGGVGCDSLTIEVAATIPSQAPVVWLAESQSVDEGDLLRFPFHFTDANQEDSHTATVDWGDGSPLEPLALIDYGAIGVGFPSHVYADDGTYTVEICVTDDDGAVACNNTPITVNNVAPTVGPITAPSDPVPAYATVSVSASFTDPGMLDSHTAVWDWGDGQTSPGAVDETGGSGSASGSHSYVLPGDYVVRLTITDKDGDSGQSSFQYVTVYGQTTAGFITGGGWIDSPEGAYAPDPSLTGKANFGFVAKYKNRSGAATPEGQTEFQFKAGDLNFHSTGYNGLVVAGPQANFEGSGTLNGESGYGFMVSAIDGAMDGGKRDKFRIKIWYGATGQLIYDTQMGDADNAAPATEIGGGSIVIHIRMDGAADGSDVIRAKKIVLGLEEPTFGADANQDNVIDGRDVIRIKKMILGIE